MDVAWDVGRLCFVFKYGLDSLDSAGASAVHAIRPSVGVVVDVGGGKWRRRGVIGGRGAQEEHERRQEESQERNTKETQDACQCLQCVKADKNRDQNTEARNLEMSGCHPHDPHGHNEAGKRPKTMVRAVEQGTGGPGVATSGLRPAQKDHGGMD